MIIANVFVLIYHILVLQKTKETKEASKPVDFQIVTDFVMSVEKVVDSRLHGSWSDFSTDISELRNVPVYRKEINSYFASKGYVTLYVYNKNKLYVYSTESQNVECIADCIDSFPHVNSSGLYMLDFPFIVEGLKVSDLRSVKVRSVELTNTSTIVEFTK